MILGWLNASILVHCVALSINSEHSKEVITGYRDVALGWSRVVFAESQGAYRYVELVHLGVTDVSAHLKQLILYHATSPPGIATLTALDVSEELFRMHLEHERQGEWAAYWT